MAEATNIGVAELDTEKEKALRKFYTKAQSIQKTTQMERLVLECLGATQISSDFNSSTGFYKIAALSAEVRL